MISGLRLSLAGSPLCCRRIVFTCRCGLSGSFRCSPPRLAATQLLQVLSQERAPTGRGLSPRKVVWLYSALGRTSRSAAMSDVASTLFWDQKWCSGPQRLSGSSALPFAGCVVMIDRIRSGEIRSRQGRADLPVRRELGRGCDVCSGPNSHTIAHRIRPQASGQRRPRLGQVAVRLIYTGQAFGAAMAERQLSPTVRGLPRDD